MNRCEEYNCMLIDSKIYSSIVYYQKMLNFTTCMNWIWSISPSPPYPLPVVCLKWHSLCDYLFYFYLDKEQSLKKYTIFIMISPESPNHPSHHIMYATNRICHSFCTNVELL